MRQSVILPDSYEHLFFYEAQKSGLVKEIPMYADELFDPDELKLAKENYNNNYLRNMHTEKQEIFQSILLFDEIILDSALMTYDYKNLVETGLFKLIDFDEFYHYNPMKEESHVEYANYLKPAIIPVLKEFLRTYFRLIPEKFNFEKFVSVLYDNVLMKKELSIHYQDFIEINKKAFDKRYKVSGFYSKLESIGVPNSMLEDRFYSDITNGVVSLYETLCWQLMISSDYDSAIMNSEFQLATIGFHSFEGNIKSSLQAYQLLQVECSKLIGTLPELNSIRDVLKLKETRKNDINNLRQELSQLEKVLREGGTEKTIEKIAKDIQKASKALSMGNNISKIGKWVNRFVIPADLGVGLVSLSAEPTIPKTILGGLLLVTAIGQASSEIDEVIRSKNNWFEVVAKIY